MSGPAVTDHARPLRSRRWRPRTGARQIGLGLFALLLALTLAHLAAPAPAQAARVAATTVAIAPTAPDPARTPAPARPCSSYPTPGSLAPAGTRLPAWLIRRYAILGAPRHAADAVPAAALHSSLTAAGLVLTQARFLGAAAFGGRVYVVPAEHLLDFKLAPDRCLPAAERSLEHELAPQLRRQYRHWALCVVVLHSSASSPSCGAADADPAALASTSGTPGYGLVANGVADVTVAYLDAPSRTLAVHHNFFILDDPHQPAAPCALQWEDATGNVISTFSGCDYALGLQAPLDAYRGYVQSTLATLSTQVEALRAAIGAGDLGAAESDWLTAHETWLDIGQDDSAYSAYGELGRELDGTAAGLPAGSADPDFTGFHRVELDLFTNHDLTTAATDSARLEQILEQIIQVPLSQALPATDNGIAAWVLRPHEILEDAIRDTLSGDDDAGSGTGVASITADVTATREFLSLLAPTLDQLAPGLIARAEGQLGALDSACDASRVNGTWVAVAALPERQREQIDADAGAAVQTLARVPDVLTNIGSGAPST